MSARLPGRCRRSWRRCWGTRWTSPGKITPCCWWDPGVLGRHWCGLLLPFSFSCNWKCRSHIYLSTVSFINEWHDEQQPLLQLRLCTLSLQNQGKFCQQFFPLIPFECECLSSVGSAAGQACQVSNHQVQPTDCYTWQCSRGLAREYQRDRRWSAGGRVIPIPYSQCEDCQVQTCVWAGCRKSGQQAAREVQHRSRQSAGGLCQAHGPGPHR